MFRRATFLRETHPYPSLLRYCFSKVVSTSASEHRTDVRTTVQEEEEEEEEEEGLFKANAVNEEEEDEDLLTVKKE